MVSETRSIKKKKQTIELTFSGLKCIYKRESLSSGNMWRAVVACLALLLAPVVSKELSDGRDNLEIPQAQEADLINYDDYNPFGEDENGT